MIEFVDVVIFGDDEMLLVMVGLVVCFVCWSDVCWV